MSNPIKKFSMRIGDLELRTCDEHLVSFKEHTTANIVKWYEYLEKEYCMSVAFWKRGKEGYDLRFVGRRPIVECDAKEFWELITVGQRRLDEYFDERGEQ